MYCKNCGNKLNDNDRFCIKCGNEVQTNIISNNNLTQIKYNKLLSNKFVCLMVVINLIFNSMIYVMTAIMENVNQASYSGLWIIFLPIILIFFNLLLWVNLILSIINIKKPQFVFLILIPIFAVLTLFLSIQWSYYNGLFYWLYIIQTILLGVLMLVKIFMYKKNKMLF